MKKRLLPLFAFLLMLSVSILPQTAQAQTQTAHKADFSADVTAQTTWKGNTHGAFTSMNLSAPGINDSDGVYEQFLNMQSGLWQAYIGVVSIGSTPTTRTGLTFCGWDTTPGKYIFDYMTNASGSVVENRCFPLESSDYNNITAFRIGYFTNGSGGMFFQTQPLNSYVGCLYNGCFVSGAPTTWGYINLEQRIRDEWNPPGDPTMFGGSLGAKTSTKA